ncbi:MAG: hypothetical protein GXN91_00960 [Epsilonproteobacteria bacterium]|nr:hypothetical protein [Campylobacterota bacterium]
MKKILFLLIVIFEIVAYANCSYNKNKIVCFDNGVKWIAFKSLMQFPMYVISGQKQKRYINSRGFVCYADSMINSIECIGDFNNQKWHFYTNMSSNITSNIVNELDRFLSSNNQNQFRNIKKVLKGDIDGDDLLEKVYVQKFGSGEIGDFYSLIVVDDNGKVLWRGPQEENSNNDYVFGEWDFGISMPEVLVDIDGDNQAELLAPAPQSDLFPQYYRVLKWNGTRFVAQRPGVMMLSSHDPNLFIWVNPYPNKNGDGVWISKLHSKNSKKKAVADVIKTQEGEDPKMGKALIRFDSNLIRVVRWIKPIPTAKSYMALISNKDKFNSRGVRLYSIRAILRQDRANFYRGRGDMEDTGIGYFRTFQARKKFEYMKIVPKNLSMDALKSSLLYEIPLLRITPKNGVLEVERVR